MNNPSELVKEMAKSIVDHLDRMEPDSTRREEVVANIIHNQLMAIVNTWTPAQPESYGEHIDITCEPPQ